MKLIRPMTLLIGALCLLLVASACSGDGSSGPSGSTTCSQLCSSAYSDISTITQEQAECMGNHFESKGYSVTNVCDEPTNASECMACIQKVNVPDSVCGEAASKCL